ncbi:MAG: HDOD domain-containing protein, partial [Actinomycetota bacterium]|nr:HDOD domain-containing protein [Actinomycetota bacterium]
MDVLVARQPILDGGLQVAGYELLFRTPGASVAAVTESERATSQVIVDAIAEIGLGPLAAGHPAYVNVSRELLLQVRPLPLPPERVVIELLEDEPVDAELLTVLRDTVRAGFTLALDDFTYRPELEPVLDLAHVVKLDVLALGRDGVLDQLAHLRGRDVRLLAEKVETHDDFAFCHMAGFHLFQGFFYARPEVMRGRGVPAERLGTVRTLSEIKSSGGSFERLEQAIAHDAGLSYKLLRYANSAFARSRAPVRSVRDALVRLGARNVQQWATVLVLAGIPDRSPEIVTTGLLRARTCQLLCLDGGAEVGDQAFTVGLFSVLDALLDASMDEVLELLPLDAAIADALRIRAG